MQKRAFLQGWLQGFWDGEGCASFILKENGHRQTYCRLYVGNTDHSLIERCTEAFDALGIEYSTRTRPNVPPRKPLELIYISRHAAILRFAELVGFASTAKTETLERMVAYIRGRGPKYSAELMRSLYVDQQMSMPDIARHFGKHSKQQWHFSKLLREYGIPTRSKSEAIKIALAKKRAAKAA